MMLARAGYRLRDPISWSNASQLAKTVLAAVLAWVIAVHVFHLSQAFMAPWAALLTVQATVFGTARGGIQQAGASVLGVLIAYGAWRVMGLNTASLTVAVLAGLLAGSVRGVRAQTTTAVTAVVVLSTSPRELRDRSPDIDGWIARADQLDGDVDRAWGVLEEARESGRFNLRRATPGLWPVYGALLVNLRNIMDALSAVAEAQPIQVASSPLAPRQPVG